MNFYKFPLQITGRSKREVDRLIMPTLGEELKQKREQRGISLAEISEATRIGTRFLKAIETDNFSILPGGIFTRSFIRAYAKHVGMSEDQAIALYLQQVAGPSGEQQDAEATSEQLPPTQSAKRPSESPRVIPQKPAVEPNSRRFEPVTFRQSPSRTSWPTIVIGAGIVVFIVIIVIALVKQLNQGRVETDSTTAAVSQKNNPPKPAVPPSSQPAAPSGQSSTASSEALDGQPLVLKLEAATGDVWIKYQVDDAKPTTLILKQGQTQDLPPAQTQVTLNYGNRLMLKLKINNRDANFPADTPKFGSQVVISRDNFQTYFQ
jgi:cytoskeletal protein RodZ